MERFWSEVSVRRSSEVRFRREGFGKLPERVPARLRSKVRERFRSEVPRRLRKKIPERGCGELPERFRNGSRGEVPERFSGAGTSCAPAPRKLFPSAEKSHIHSLSKTRRKILKVLPAQEGLSAGKAVSRPR